MQKMYKPARVGLIFALVAIMLTIYVSALYRIQIYETWVAEDAPAPPRVISRIVTLPAARGNIYDRNGVLLASGRPSYNITLDRESLIATGFTNMNETIHELIYTAMDEEVSYTDTFPITRGAPFEYVSDMTAAQRNRLESFFEFHNIDPDIPAPEFLAWLRRHYGIDYTIGILDARLIIGVRYELEMRVIIHNITPYVFARDIGAYFVAMIEERGYIGVYIESTYVREYHTTYAAHILGYIGRMSPDEYEIYKNLGYPMDAQVGKVGAESAFEDRLHGREGVQIIRTAVDGTVMDVFTKREPEPGKHINLTIDLGLQVVVEHSLLTQVDLINQLREEEARKHPDEEAEDDRITGGAVCVVDVRTGELLAAASYPTYNPQTLAEDFRVLNTDPMTPMLNRATHGRYIPGSTFKMVTAFAGLRYSGYLDRYQEIYDAGRFTKYAGTDGFAPSCWVYPLTGTTHGSVNVVQALECSCNYFFMTVADQLPPDSAGAAESLAQVASEFGLGVSTGIELSENTGRLATPEWKREFLNEGWWSADTVVTGFGQGDNRFTPVQLASYAATIANGGTRYSLSILSKVKSADFSELIHVHEPIVLNQIEETEYIDIIKEGMVAVTTGSRGTARSVFGNYPIPVAAKTGTAQVEGRDINSGIFICYAPADNPEIAISIVVEKGGSGSAVMDIARMIFDYYFRSENAVLATPYGELIT